MTQSETAKRSYEDYLSESSFHSSCPDSHLMLPRMMTSENGDQKCVYNERTAVFARRKRDTEITATKLTSAVHATADKRDKAGSHGWAPLGMIILTTGNAFRFGGVASIKKPLKESNLEMYNRIQAEKEVKAGRKNMTAVKKLKKEGKVSTLASLMYSKR